MTGKEKAPEREQMEIEQVGIRMPLKMKEKLSWIANERGMNFNSFVLSVLSRYLDRQ